MAMSKQVDIDTVCTRINRVHGPPLPTLIDKNEIEQMCCMVKQKAISIDLIKHYMGGPNMQYHFIENDESFEAFDYLRSKLMDQLNDQKLEIMFFEDRKCVSSSVIVVVVKKPKQHGSREHIIMKILIRMTIMVEPRVAYCRFFDLTGELVSLHTFR